MTDASASPDNVPVTPDRRGFWGTLEDQFGFRQLVADYLIPAESNSIWYLLGGVLAIALAVEILTGFLLSLVYAPDANLAYATTAQLIATPGWSIIINFHFYNAFVIFGLVLLHMVRVFVAGGYRGGKQGLRLVGVGLAALTFLISITGEALHWDEVDPVEHRRSPRCARVGCSIWLHHRCPAGDPDGEREAGPDLRAPHLDRAHPPGSVHRLALPADPVQGHLEAVLAECQRPHRCHSPSTFVAGLSGARSSWVSSC